MQARILGGCLVVLILLPVAAAGILSRSTC